MPVNPYDDRKVPLRRALGNGDLDIVRASYTRRKANVTEAYVWLSVDNTVLRNVSCLQKQFKGASRIDLQNNSPAIYTMHNKFSNCFVWVSQSTSDFEFYVLS